MWVCLYVNADTDTNIVPNIKNAIATTLLWTYAFCTLYTLYIYVYFIAVGP